MTYATIITTCLSDTFELFLYCRWCFNKCSKMYEWDSSRTDRILIATHDTVTHESCIVCQSREKNADTSTIFDFEHIMNQYQRVQFHSHERLVDYQSHKTHSTWNSIGYGYCSNPNNDIINPFWLQLLFSTQFYRIIYHSTDRILNFDFCLFCFCFQMAHRSHRWPSSYQKHPHCAASFI